MDHYIFIEYSGQGHLHPQRVQSAKYGNVASLKLSHFGPEHLSYLKESSENLILLDMSNAGLTKLSADMISGLNNLQILILNNNQLSDNSFCKEFSTVLGKSLKEVSICNNLLVTPLPNMDNFVKLTRLKVSNNQITNLKGIEKLKRLKLLMMENNDLSQIGVGFYSAKRLENVYLSGNNITSISISIRNMVNLREIDLSNNAIKAIPGDLFILPKIEILKLAYNKIIKIPKFKMTSRLNNPVAYIDLSFNSIIRFPDCVMRIAENLDLSNNKIKTVPSSILKKISYQSTKTINLKNNPILDPPKEICESGLKCMVQYYEEFEGTDSKYQGIKVFCFGIESPEKSRTINILSDCSDDEGSQSETSNILEIYDVNSKFFCSTSNDNYSFNIKFLNMSGKSTHSDLLNFFMTSHSLNLIFINIDNWTEDSFSTFIGCWLWNSIFRNNEAIFCLIGLSSEKISDDVQLKCEEIKELTKTLFSDYTDMISDEIRKIESKEKITAVMSQSLKRFIQLKSIKVVFDENIICVNNRDSKSMKKLTTELNKVMTNKLIFPNVANHVPSFWSDVQTYIEEESSQSPITSFKDFEVILQQKFNLKSAARNVAKYLHEVGSVIWNEHSMAPLNQWIITSPLVFIECFQVLFRPDLKTYLEDSSDPDKNIKRFKKQFPSSKYGYKRSCEALLTESILLPELTVILFENILPTENIGKFLFFLCQCWSLGYIVDYPGIFCTDWSAINEEFRDNCSDITNSIASQEYTRTKSAEPRISESRRSVESRRSHDAKKIQIPPIFLSSLSNKNSCSSKASDQWDLKSSMNIVIYYTFPVGYPNLIFHQATVRTSDRAKFNVSIIDHWIDGYQAQITNEPIFFRIERSEDSGRNSFISYEFNYFDAGSSLMTDSSDEFRASEIWRLVHGMLNDMDELLNSYQGLWFKRSIGCPHCKELSFPGTWHIYNDNDSSATLSCDSCENKFPVYLLEPPMVSKNASAEEIIRNIRKQFDRD